MTAPACSSAASPDRPALNKASHVQDAQAKPSISSTLVILACFKKPEAQLQAKEFSGCLEARTATIVCPSAKEWPAYRIICEFAQGRFIVDGTLMISVESSPMQPTAHGRRRSLLFAKKEEGANTVRHFLVFDFERGEFCVLQSSRIGEQITEATISTKDFLRSSTESEAQQFYETIETILG